MVDISERKTPPSTGVPSTALGELLHGPAVAVGIGEEDEPAPREFLDRADIERRAPPARPCAASMSATTSWSPSTEPGFASVSPLPMAIEQPDPGGVSWTKRISSLTRWS